MMLGIIIAVLLIHLGVYLTFDNKFWFGASGVASVPLLYTAFLIDIHAHTEE